MTPSTRKGLEALREWLISHRTWVCDQTAAELATEHIATIEAALARESEQDQRASAAQTLAASTMDRGAIGETPRPDGSPCGTLRQSEQSEAHQSRSQLRRIAAMKGEDAPTFESAPAGEGPK